MLLTKHRKRVFDIEITLDGHTSHCTNAYKSKKACKETTGVAT